MASLSLSNTPTTIGTPSSPTSVLRGSTDSTDAADVHLQPRPGTDGALALGMAQVIVAEGLHDADFLRDHAVGVEPYLERLSDFPLQRTSEITGLGTGEIRDLARAFARRKPALVVAGFGLQRHRHAGQAMRAVALLPALTGNLGIAGGGWQYASLNSHCLRPLPSLPSSEGAQTRSFPTSRLGRSLQDLKDPPLRAAWFEKANPVSQHPRTKEVIRGFAGLELVVVVDQFLTDTARLAHYVLPAKRSQNRDRAVARAVCSIRVRQRGVRRGPRRALASHAS